jgi:hypothetical protein
MTDRYEPPHLDELIGDDVPDGLRAELERVDALLRAVPALPELPPRLREASPPVERQRARRFTFRRAAFGLAAVAAVAVAFFALGSWVASDNLDVQAVVPMESTENAADASGTLHLGPADGSGNQTIRLAVSGLPELPQGAYYFLWLAKDGEYAAPCGTFAVGAGETTAEWTVAYDLGAYDEWVVTARGEGQPREDPPWLLKAST